MRHPAPEDSRDAFAPGSVLVVPLRLASGVRMKILEAWARGVPVVATPEAVGGLGATPGREYLTMGGARGLVEALRSLQTGRSETGGERGEGTRSASWVEAGRERLGAHHAPRRVAAALLEIYRQLAS